MIRSERGSVTLWTLGLSLLLLVFGGLAIDFWRGLALQRELAAVADSAAVAAASGVDEGLYRETGQVRLDAAQARTLALESVAFQDTPVLGVEVTVLPDRSRVTVEVFGEVELGLLGVLIGDTEPLTVRAVATAAPRLLP